MSLDRHFYSPEETRRFVAEMLGTFVLVFAGTGAIVVNDVSQGAVSHVGIALTFGLVVMAMIFAIGEISGAHLNPAVTCGFYLAGSFPARSVIPYIVCQLAGALLASSVLWLLFAHATLGITSPSGTATQSFVLELILTAILMFVILTVTSGSKEQRNFAGIAIGGVIGLEAMFAGPISGASMNPARSLAPAIVSGTLTDLWIYLLAPTVGAAVGVMCSKVIR